MPKTKRRRRNHRFTARTADKHVLYQLSVQDAAAEAGFLDRIFRKLRRRPPETLREDFCGTALLCSEWVKYRGRTAVGIDLDRRVLDWAKKNNLAPLGERQKCVRLFRRDVRARTSGRFDVSVALNFSYFVFKERAELRRYFEGVRRSMAKDGIFVVDLYGGYESWEPMRERRRLKGFTYFWDQAKVNPLTNEVLNHIHFKFPDGSKMLRAFTYDWRMWTIPEIREILAEAGFSGSTVHWEDADDEGAGTGTFRPRTYVDQEPAWIAYVVAER
jgi:SAM-dependent methyltransferase